MSEAIVRKLDELGELKAEADLLKIKKQELIDSILTTEVKRQLAEIDEETAPQFENINKRLGEIEASIKTDVIQFGKSVKGNSLQAVWNKGRVKWNDSGLMQYLSVHPEIAYLREVGNPSVAIRKVG